MANHGRILLADDEPVFLKSTADLLRMRGYECDTARDADEATERLETQQYDLLISDIKMPGNEGLALIKRIEELAAGMSIILVTGNPSVATAVESIHLPVVAYLLKPLDFDQLLPKVDQCIQRSQTLRHVRDVRGQLTSWHRDLEATESLLERSDDTLGTDPVSAFVNLNLCNVANALVKFGNLTEGMAEGRSEKEKRELVASAQLDAAYAALTEAIGVLEETRSLFKSKKLGRLRRKLQTVVDAWQKPESRNADSTTPVKSDSSSG